MKAGAEVGAGGVAGMESGRGGVAGMGFGAGGIGVVETGAGGVEQVVPVHPPVQVQTFGSSQKAWAVLQLEQVTSTVITRSEPSN